MRNSTIADRLAYHVVSHAIVFPETLLISEHWDPVPELQPHPLVAREYAPLDCVWYWPHCCVARSSKRAGAARAVPKNKARVESCMVRVLMSMLSDE